MNTVIVVDDDRTFTGLIKTVFELEGYQAVIVSNPDDVVATARQVKPTLVLMDIHAGRGDTLSILRELKTDEILKGVPVIMNSGMDRCSECLAAGADAFLLKPFRPSELLTKVVGLLDREDKDV